MKELILFSFVLLFIACQNQSLPDASSEIKNANSTKASAALSSFQSMACDNANEETALTQPIEFSETSGFELQTPAPRSEAFLSYSSELICVAEITNESEEPAAEPLATVQTLQAAPLVTETSSQLAMPWSILTDKWEVISERRTCRDLNLEIENPTCEETAFLAEEGQFFSPALERPLASL